MTDSSSTQSKQWNECWEQAEKIVASYRAEAPEGCDPVATWAVVAIGAGAAISAGATAYSANKSSKAAKEAGNVKFNTTPVLLDDPAQVDPYQVLQQLYGANQANFGNASEQARTVNRFNLQQEKKGLRKIQPEFMNLQRQIGQNALSYAQGELPQDVQDNLTRAAAQQGIQGGFGYGSQGFKAGAGGNLNLRNLGLTSLDLSKYGTSLGMQVNQNAKALLPNMSGLQDWLLNPQQSLGISQYNTGVENQFSLQNNQLQNAAIGSQNQALANQAQSQYAQQLQQAQMVGQIGQQVGGAISGLGTGAGIGASTSGWGGNYSPTGTGYASYRGTTIPKAQLA